MTTLGTPPSLDTSEGQIRVLLNARDLFVERGYDGVSMQQIAAATGITKAAIYYHFRDKDELFGQVIRRELEQAYRVLSRVLEDEAPIRTHLERMAVAAFGWFQSDFGRLMGDLKHHVSPARQEAIGCYAVTPQDVVLPRVKRAMADGELRADLDPDLVVSLYFGLLWSQMQQARLADAAPSQELASTIVDVLLCGIAARPCGPAATATGNGSANH